MPVTSPPVTSIKKTSALETMKKAYSQSGCCSRVSEVFRSDAPMMPSTIETVNKLSNQIVPSIAISLGAFPPTILPISSKLITAEILPTSAPSRFVSALLAKKGMHKALSTKRTSPPACPEKRSAMYAKTHIQVVAPRANVSGLARFCVVSLVMIDAVY